MFSYSFHEVLGETEEESKQKVLDFFTTDFFNNTRLVAGAKEGIASLAKKTPALCHHRAPATHQTADRKIDRGKFPKLFFYGHSHQRMARRREDDP